jgi:hypothetical protein
LFGRRERKGAARVEPDEQQAAPSLPDAVGNRLFWAAPLRCCLCLLPFRGSRGSVVYSYAIVVLRERVRLLVLAARNATASRHWARGVIHGPPVEAPPSLLPLPRCTCMQFGFMAFMRSSQDTGSRGGGFARSQSLLVLRPTARSNTAAASCSSTNRAYKWRVPQLTAGQRALCGESGPATRCCLAPVINAASSSFEVALAR